MVLPGFSAGDGSTRLLRQYLRSLGYRVAGWGLGVNHGNVRKLVPQVITRVIRRSERFGQAVSLIGWSLGGVIAREVARERPSVAQQVITFGTPVVGGPKYTATAEWYQRKGLDLDTFEAEVHERNQIPIDVPITAIYTKRDGVVSWKASIDRYNRHAEHVEVTGTHVGLGINPDVWRIIAQRLASTLR